MGNDLVNYRVSQVLAASDVLQDAAIAESAITDLLSQAAAEQDRGERWERYEELKAAAASYVGWGAKKSGLKDTSIYEAFVEALDELLPAPVEDRG